MEQLMKLLPDGTPSGVSVDRNFAHETGIWHSTSQVFVYKYEGEKLYILLQMRCADKDSFPNCWDISCAGHVPFGMDYLENAQKELQEELGISVNAENLEEVFLHKTEKQAVFYGKPFIDRQFSMVYALECDKSEEYFVYQKEEISSVRWFSYSDILKMIETGKPDNCLNKEKFEKVYEFISRNRTIK